MSDQVPSALVKKNKRNDLWFLISVVIGILIYFFLPATGGLTPMGVGMLAVFIPTVIMWIFVDTGWPSLLAIMMLVALDVVPISSALAVGFGTNTTWLTAAFVFTSIGLKESGFLDKVAMWLVSRKFTDGKPWVFLAIFLFGMMLIGMWMSHAVTIILFATIGSSVCESVNIKKGEKMYTAILICVLWMCITAEAIIPYGKITGMTVMAVMEGMGYTFDLMPYLKMSLPFAVLYPALAWLVLRFVLKPDVSKFKNYNGQEFREKLKTMPFTRKEKLSLFLYVFLVLSLLLPSMTFLGPVAAFFTKVGTAWMPLLCVVAMAVIRVKGEPIVELGRGFAQLPWPTLCFMAASLVFATFFGSADLGITTMLSSALTNAISGAGGAGLMGVAIAAFAIAIVATNFLSNSLVAAVATAAFVPVLASAYDSGSSFMHPWSVAGMIIMMAGVSILTPAATAMAPFILGPHVELKAGFKSSSVLIGLSFVLAVILVFAIGY